jgi:hypothetical protein
MIKTKKLFLYCILFIAILTFKVFTSAEEPSISPSTQQVNENNDTQDIFSNLDHQKLKDKEGEINKIEEDRIIEEEEEDIFSEEKEQLNSDQDANIINKNLGSEPTLPGDVQGDKEQNESTIIYAEYANIALLDKNTGQKLNYQMHENDTINYCNLEITLVQCAKNINPFKQDDLAFFKIYKKEGNEKNIIFSGWISKNNAFTSNVSKSIILIAVLGCFVN